MNSNDHFHVHIQICHYLITSSTQWHYSITMLGSRTIVSIVTISLEVVGTATVATIDTISNNYGTISLHG